MPIWEIRDSNGNVHSVDLAKANIKSVNDIEDLVKNELKKFDEKKKKNSSRPSLRETQAMQARNRGGY